ncbi:SLBB domain-containing protein [Candidatus Woesearchaeota archaeon]|nr:SLBB domain-containing protein [Candidatus Woesearchaeota archaeon]
MQILRKTELKGLEKAKELGAEGVIDLLNKKGLTGRGGAGFPTGKKWKFALDKEADEKFVICNADEGEPGTFKDKFIMEKVPETLIEGILICCNVIGAKKAFIYLRGEYEYLESKLKKKIKEVVNAAKSDISIEIVVGAGSYVCGEETAIIESIEGFRGQPYYKPPYPPSEGLWGKPTVINNVETLANVPQAILFDDWNADLRLFCVSGNVTKPGIYELPVGVKLSKVMELAKPKNKVKAIYYGCYGGCHPYKDMELTHENICGEDCVSGSCTMIVVDEKQSMVELAYQISKFFTYESCGKCTPCREGSIRLLLLLRKIRNNEGTKKDLELLDELGEHIRLTSLCGLGQSCSNHIRTALKHFRKEFEEKIK